MGPTIGRFCVICHVPFTGLHTLTDQCFCFMCNHNSWNMEETNWEPEIRNWFRPQVMWADCLSIFLCGCFCLSVYCSSAAACFLLYFVSSGLQNQMHSLVWVAQWYLCVCVYIIYKSMYVQGSLSAVPSITGVRFPSHHRNLNKLLPLLRAHTQTHVWMFGRRFWRHRAQLSLPYNTAVFYSQLPSGCYMHFRSCVPVNPTPVLTLTGRRCHCALNVTAQVNLCPAVTAPIEGCLSTRILNKLVLLLLMDSDPYLQIYHGALTSGTPPHGPGSTQWSHWTGNNPPIPSCLLTSCLTPEAS